MPCLGFTVKTPIKGAASTLLSCFLPPSHPGVFPTWPCTMPVLLSLKFCEYKKLLFPEPLCLLSWLYMTDYFIKEHETTYFFTLSFSGFWLHLPSCFFPFFYPPSLPSLKYISPLGCKPLEDKGILFTPSLQCWLSSCQCSPNSAECERQATLLPFLPSLPWTHTHHSREQFKLSGHEPVWRVITT